VRVPFGCASAPFPDQRPPGEQVEEANRLRKDAGAGEPGDVPGSADAIPTTPTVKSIPAGVQAVFPMLVCRSPEAEMTFCAAAFGAVEQVRRPGPDGSAIHIAMRINDAFLVVQSEFRDVVASRAPPPDGSSPVVIFVYVTDVDQAVERAVSMGATILVPAQNQFWGDRTARIIGPSGHVWIVASRIEETTEELRATRWSEIRGENQGK